MLDFPRDLCRLRLFCADACAIFVFVRQETNPTYYAIAAL
jgi:hypothetical protein